MTRKPVALEHSDADDKIYIPAIADDGTLFPIEKIAAHQSGQLHAAVSTFVFSNGCLLIQQRAATKYHSGLLWANTCCTHPRWAEDVADAAHRRLVEELGLKVELTEANIFEYRVDVTCGLIEHERVHIFRGEVDQLTTPISPNPREVAGTRWVRLDALQADIKTNPGAYAPWFLLYAQNWKKLGL